MKLLVRYFLVIALIASAIIVNAQSAFKRSDSIVVTIGSDTLIYPWVGGLNNPQFWAADINNDGIEDLVVFNRGQTENSVSENGNKVLTFINHGTAGKVDYIYSPQYQRFFPILNHYMIMVDMNCDGVSDVLTSSDLPYIIMYKGHFDNFNNPYFSGPDTLLYYANNNYATIPVSYADLPAVVDVDNDGDIDILAFDYLANAYINEFQNMSKEYSNTCGDSIIFTQAHYCWGDIAVKSTNHVTISEPYCPYLPRQRGAGQARPRDGGGTICAFDADQDDDVELLLGDVAYNTLNFVINGGRPDSAHMIGPVDSTFPKYDRPVNIPAFPAAFNLDVNNDGKKDLVIAPNIPGTSENYACAWYYKNISTNDTDHFSFQTDTFMVNEMVDLGQGAYPAFVDIDGDGLQDLIVGNTGYYVNNAAQKAGLAYFRNIGTQTQPSYQLITRDYANISSFRISNLLIKSPAPTFGDMDGDGDMDMVIGDNTGELQYFQNTAGIGNPCNFVLAGPTYFGISVGSNSVPFIYDVDGDSVPDLLVGRQSGNVYYYRNRGTRTSPHFDAVTTNPSFGNVNVRLSNSIIGYSSPVVTTMDSTNILYLLVGNIAGQIYQYEFNKDSINGGSFNLVTHFFSDVDEGEFVNLAVYHNPVSNSSFMVTGNRRGGLSFYVYGDISVHDTIGLALNDTVSVNGSSTILTGINSASAQQGDTVTISHNGGVIFFIDTAITPLVLQVGDTVIVNGNTVYVNGVPVGIVPGVGIEAVHNITAFNLYPNPANGKITLVWQVTNNLAPYIELTDMMGRKVLSMQVDGDGPARCQKTIDISSLSKGIYTCRLIAGGQYVTKKLLVQ